MKQPPKGMKGIDVLLNPAYNKGTAFSEEERTRYDLHGLLPPRVTNLELQISRSMASMRRKANDIERYIYLTALQGRNEHLFYALLQKHFEELLPLIYTPTVGEACKEYANIYRQTKGIYISANDRGNIKKILSNWPQKDIRVIVVTDGERILGLGDLGANGMGIPIGKLQVYVGCAGIHPSQCLPVMIDVGTKNKRLKDDPLYLGLNQERIPREAYDELIAEFIQEVGEAYPKALVQFEDFLTPNAYRLLQEYQDKTLCFNDDIQGTAAVALAGVIASTRISGIKFSDLKIMFLGAGSAATGIADLICLALQEEGLTVEEARKRLWFVDKEGLVTSKRDDLLDHNLPYAHHVESMTFSEGMDFVKPHVLIGATGAPGTFTQKILEKMAAIQSRPTIFALSNPTSHAECTPTQAYQWTKGQGIFASGSPFDPVLYEGKKYRPAQGNNAYIFPAMGLATSLTEASRLNNESFLVAAHTLANLVSDDDLAAGAVYPPLSKIREVTNEIAVAVSKYIYDHNLTDKPPAEDIRSEMLDCQYNPNY